MQKKKKIIVLLLVLLSIVLLYMFSLTLENPPFTLQLENSSVSIPTKEISWYDSEEDYDHAEARLKDSPLIEAPLSSKVTVNFKEKSNNEKIRVVYWDMNQYKGGNRVINGTIVEIKDNTITLPKESGEFMYAIVYDSGDFPAFAFKVKTK